MNFCQENLFLKKFLGWKFPVSKKFFKENLLKKFSCLQNVWWQKSFGLKKLFGSKNCVVAGGWIWVVCKVILVFRICLRIWKAE